MAGFVTGVAMLFIVVIALAGLGLVVVNALRDSAWGTFTIFVTIPIAILMGLYMYKWRPGDVTTATVFGVVALILAVDRGTLGRRGAVGPGLRAQQESARRRARASTASSPRCCRSGCCSLRATTCRPS